MDLRVYEAMKELPEKRRVMEKANIWNVEYSFLCRLKGRLKEDLGEYKRRRLSAGAERKQKSEEMQERAAA